MNEFEFTVDSLNILHELLICEKINLLQSEKQNRNYDRLEDITDLLVAVDELRLYISENNAEGILKFSR